jgi:hypothetical protein
MQQLLISYGSKLLVGVHWQQLRAHLLAVCVSQVLRNVAQQHGGVGTDGRLIVNLVRQQRTEQGSSSSSRQLSRPTTFATTTSIPSTSFHKHRQLQQCSTASAPLATWKMCSLVDRIPVASAEFDMPEPLPELSI